MYAVTSIPTAETSHHTNCGAPSVGRTRKRYRREVELRGSEVVEDGSRRYFGEADLAVLPNRGHSRGHSPMRQVADVLGSMACIPIRFPLAAAQK